MKSIPNRFKPRDIAPSLTEAARQMAAVVLTGPRQSGKTTLCRKMFPDHPYVTLEALDMRDLATKDPRTFLARYPEGAIIDEVQRAPDLLSYLQVDIDENGTPGRWILTGSQNLTLLASVGQSLAGRAAIHHLLPLARGEIERFDSSPESLNETLYAGAYPPIFDRKLAVTNWLQSYIATYIERDVRSIRNIGDLSAFQNFIRLCAGRTARPLNYTSLTSDCGISQPTAKAWLSILEASFIIFRLPPFHANLRNRLTKMPKLHFYDTGLVCWLLGIRAPEQLETHPLRGAIFETWMASEIVKQKINQGETGGLSFYRDARKNETDLIVESPGGATLVEAKSSQTASPFLFKGIRKVRKQLDSTLTLGNNVVVYGGDDPQRHADGYLIPWNRLHSLFPNLPERAFQERKRSAPAER